MVSLQQKAAMTSADMGDGVSSTLLGEAGCQKGQFRASQERSTREQPGPELSRHREVDSVVPQLEICASTFRRVLKPGSCVS